MLSIAIYQSRLGLFPNKIDGSKSYTIRTARGCCAITNICWKTDEIRCKCRRSHSLIDSDFYHEQAYFFYQRVAKS
jgi:hypothetical protein